MPVRPLGKCPACPCVETALSDASTEANYSELLTRRAFMYDGDWEQLSRCTLKRFYYTPTYRRADNMRRQRDPRLRRSTGDEASQSDYRNVIVFRLLCWFLRAVFSLVRRKRLPRTQRLQRNRCRFRDVIANDHRPGERGQRHPGHVQDVLRRSSGDRRQRSG